MGCGNNSLFGPNQGEIKYQGGDLVSIEGSNILERLIMNDLRIPYKQLVKGRVILKPGQTDYLMNHLGIGDQVTFLGMVARYNPKSKLEADNYILYSFVDHPTVQHPMVAVTTLTGNSTHRISQLYLTNPNPNYAVNIDIMVAVIDDGYTPFTTIGPVINFTNGVFVGTTGSTFSGTASSLYSSDFYYEQGLTYSLDLYNLIGSVTDDVDGTIDNTEVRFNGTTVSTGYTQSTMVEVSVVDSSYNITTVNLYINLI